MTDTYSIEKDIIRVVFFSGEYTPAPQISHKHSCANISDLEHFL